MKKFLIIGLLLSCVQLQARDIYISFKSVDTAVSVDSILVTNLRTSQRIKLFENDSLLLTSTTGVLPVSPFIPESGKIYPNPNRGEAWLLFSTKTAGETYISLYDASGQLLQWNDLKLDPGMHRFRLTLPAAGIYFVSVKQREGMFGFKAVCTGELSQSISINYEGSEEITQQAVYTQRKSASFSKEMVYIPGDILYYSVFSGRNNTIMTDSPSANTDYELEFHPCVDNDQNSYPVVKIGEQWWMAKNLYWLPGVSPSSVGSEASPYYYVYGYEGTSVEEAKNTTAFRTFGVLYNWAAAMNSEGSSNLVPSGVRGVCPDGWHLPSDSEWAILLSHLGGETVAGGKLKETLSGTWMSPNLGASNSSGFSALPGGTRTDTKIFYGLRLQNYLWSATGYSAFDAWMRGTYNGNASLKRYIINKQYGLSIRCLKDGFSIPTIATTPITTFSQTTASGGGNITGNGNAQVTARGVCWNTIGNPTTTGNKTTDGEGSGIFSSNLTGLTPNTLYYVRAYAVNSQGTAYGNQISFTTAPVLSLATISSAEPAFVTISSALLGGNVTSDGNAPVSERGIVYAVSQNPTILNTKITVGSGIGIFSNTVTGFSPNSTYYVRAYAINSQGTAYGNQVSFTTSQLLSLPVVTTSTVTGITQTTAIAGGNISGNGNAPVTARGVCWNTTGNPTTAGNKTKDGEGSGIFTSNLTGLTPNTLYYVRAYAVNSVGTAYGDQISFTTAPVLSLATISTAEPAFVTINSALLGGNVTSDGNSIVTERGIVYAMSQNPTILNTKITVGSGIGIFSNTVTGFSPNTTYYVRAYAINSQGTAYGNQISFTTTQLLSLPVLATSTVTGINQTTAIAGGNITSDGNAPVSARGVCWNTTGNPTTAGNKTTDGEGSGIFASNLTGLTPNTLYYVRAYAVNSVGTAYGEQKSFTTAPVLSLATIITTEPSSVTANSALLGGEVTSDGNAPVSERGIVYAVSQNPTTLNTKVIMGSGIGIFNNTITGLISNTVYYVRAYAINSQGIAYGEQKSFTTVSILSPATVVTTDPANITNNAALLGGNVISDGNTVVTEKGIVYSLSQNPTTVDTKVVIGSGTGNFSNTITGLLPNTLYYVKAYAINSQGIAYGDQKSFTTGQVLSLATVVTSEAATITTTSSLLGGEVTKDGNTTVIEKGIVYSLIQNPTTADVKVSMGSGISSFSTLVTGLTPNTLYYVRAYAINSQGTAYGNQISFTTAKLLTLASVTTTTITTFSQTTATAGGNITSDGNAPVTARGVCWNTTGNPTTSGNKTTDGEGSGIFSSNLTGLTPNTLYYVRAYAVNSQGTAYGDQISFTTAPVLSLATISTAEPAFVNTNSALLGGNVTSDGNSNVTERGIVYAVSQNPTILNTKITVGSGIGIFSNTVTGFSPNTTYYVRAYAINSQGTAYGNQVSFITSQLLSLPVLTTSTVTGITQTTAIAGGNITSNGNAPVTARGVCWNTTGNPTTAGNKTTDGEGSGIFASNLTGLTPNTLYYVRAYAVNSVGTAYGEQKSFTTAPVLSLATISTAEPAFVTINSALLGGNVASDGNSNVTERGIVYALSQNPTILNTKITVGSGIGIFSNTVTGFSPNTTYYVRAYAINSQGTAYGNQVSFTTAQLLSLPVLATSTVTGITQTTAIAGGNITSDGNAQVTARGVCWNTTGNPTTAGNKTTDGEGSGIFASNLTGLTPNTLYYVRAYAVNSVGTAYGEQKSFATAPVLSLATIITTEPSSVTANSALLGGEVTSDGSAPVSERGIVYAVSQNPTILNTKITVGSGIGIFSNTVTGFSPNTTYYVRAYAINSQGTAYGNQVSFTTTQLLSLPVLATSAVTGITQTTAIAGGNITSDGNAQVTARGVCWNTTGNPTTAGNKTTNGEGSGIFTSQLTGLTPNTLHYVRAYATNSMGTAYGEQVTFIAENTTPVVITGPVTNITRTTATANGNVLHDGGEGVSARGICWNTSGNPTIADKFTIDGSGIGSFSSSLTGLGVGKTCYVRAYATNNKGTAYGETVSFTTTVGDAGTITDIEGNIYQTITIGTQIWMAENLKTTKFKDGAAIPYITDGTTWLNLSTGAYCWSSNNSVYKDIYGGLYNHFAVTDIRGLCPSGWHIPNDEEWTTLENFLIANGYNYDGTNTGNKIAKSMASSTNWNSSSVIGSVGNTDFPTFQNKSGFSGLPGGYRDSDGLFYYRGSWGVWWSSTKATGQTSWSRDLGRSEVSTGRNGDDLESGLSVRCIKD